MPEHYDVIVIGTGAGGGTLAHTLAASGKRILLLERGNFLPRETQNWDSKSVFLDGKYISPDTWYDADGKAFQPQVHYFVGGADEALRRGPVPAAAGGLRRDQARRRHLTGVAGELRRVRTLVHQGGVAVPGPRQPRRRPDRGSLVEAVPVAGRLPRTAHPGDHGQSGRRRLPPVHGAVRDPPRRSRPAPQHVYPLHVVRRLSVHGARQVRRRDDRRAPAADGTQRDLARRGRGGQAGDRSHRWERDRRGRHAQGAQETYAADIVVVAAGASNSAKLLLQSANDRHPNGLANGSDQVGRNYMYHNSKAVVALSKERNDTVFQKTLGLNDFYLGGPGDDRPLGNIQMVGKSNGWAMKGEEPKLTMLAPHWSLDEVAEHAVDFWLTTEDLPDPDNRVTVDADGHVHLAYTSNNDDEAAGLYHELKKILNHIGMAEHHVLGKNFYMKMNIPIAGCAHQAGTCRFGSDPATSVLDPTARPTSSTTSTSSTPASSPASAPSTRH